ncbi:MAG: MFS transporter, partial [Phenylobacterium sp.]
MADATASAPPAIPLVSDAYRRYALVVLLAVYTLNFLDRQIVTILAEPIKNDLGLQDWQLGLMTGLAFAVFYTFLGLPIAWAADRFNRAWIITASLTAWSGFTALCGLAQNFPQLVAARIGVGVGEAGCTPTAHALIADYVPKAQRASALAFFSIGTPLGSLIGLAMGGII